MLTLFVVVLALKFIQKLRFPTSASRYKDHKKQIIPVRSRFVVFRKVPIRPVTKNRAN